MTDTQAGHIYTVSKLTRQIKSLLEEKYPFVWITGEISNYAVPSSGHSYFTLKDNQSMIQAVMFKNQKRGLKFNPENGLKIIGLARLSLYEPRGSYQLIFEHIEPEGAGSAQIAFEQLKNKLAEKGFFDDQHKKSIPFLPGIVSVITSATSAAIKDIINISQRRFPNCCLEIFPVNVQGEESVSDICTAITFVNDRQQSDLIILARGGGSLEDLAAFNSELVANAIFDSKIPVITGIGHETDFTIADFVSDLRAPTPSAAAELAFPLKKNLLYTVQQLEDSLNRTVKKRIHYYRQKIDQYMARLKSPERLLYDLRFKLEDFHSRLTNGINRCQYYNREKVKWFEDSLKTQNPYLQTIQYKKQIHILASLLNQSFKARMETFAFNHDRLNSKLDALNPTAILQRGYSISRFIHTKAVITNANDVQKNDQIEVILHQGRLITKVEEANGQKKII
ncbi:MAG: exodeoxyribonuclease VII large subunit [Pseudomonadota bacterium]